MDEPISGMISVVIPTYNRLEMLRELLSSIREQDYGPIEIIVVDDGSSDGTQEAMEVPESGVRYYRNPRNSGPGFSRKRGFLAARGEYTIFADDDDLYTDPCFFTRAAEVLKADTDHTIAFTAANAKIFYEDGQSWRNDLLPMQGRIDAAEYLAGFSGKYPKPLSTFTAVFRRDSLLNGGLDEITQVDDRIIYLRALLAGDAYILSDFIGVYRVHKSNYSATVSAEFTIALHRENRAVYDEIRRRHLLPAPEDWWYEQAWIALRYYILSQDPDLSGLRSIFLFLRRQGISLRRDLILFRRALAYWHSRRRITAAR